MAFNFSLAQKDFTPIRPQKIERLFSPRTLNDVTYQVTKYPRQSTCLKNEPPLELSVSLDEPLEVKDENTIPEYKPYYQIKDPHPIRAVSFHPSGDVFAVGSNSRALGIWMYPSEEELENFINEDLPLEPKKAFQFVQIHRGSVYCVSFNGNGNLLATGSNDQTVHVIKYNSQKHLPEGNEYKLTMHSGTIRDLCFMSNGGENDSSLLVTAGAGEHEIHITDCNNMKSKQILRGHESTVMSLHHWSDPHSFVSGSLDGTIRLWDVRSNRCMEIIDKQGKTPVGVVRIEPTGKLLVSGHVDGNCMLYDMRGGKVVQLFKAHENEIRTLNFSQKSYYLLTASYDHKVKLIDIQGDLTKKLPCVDIAELNDKVVQTAWHPREYTFITTSADGLATLWTIPEFAKANKNKNNLADTFAD